MWNRTRLLILPAALSVTSFGVVLACGSEDDESTQSVALEACADKPSGSCQRCEDPNGKATCGPSKDCFLEAGGKCSPGGSS
ncbi:MAG TPA: hypothetical protein PKD61_15340 [Polyangiaceae bacterium]|nr:hypothetical protein [Polyangiaceae bacterium]